MTFTKPPTPVVFYAVGILRSEMARGGTYLADSSLRAARFSVWRACPLLGVSRRGSWSCCSRLGLRLHPQSLLEREVHPESDGSGGAVFLKSIQVPGREEGGKKGCLSHLVLVVQSVKNRNKHICKDRVQVAKLDVKEKKEHEQRLHLLETAAGGSIQQLTCGKHI